MGIRSSPNHHEIFIRRSWYSILPSLDATIICRIKKMVVGVTQLITALVSIHSSMTFLADMYSFLDPPGRTVLFSVTDRSLFSVDCMICLIYMVGECWLEYHLLLMKISWWDRNVSVKTGLRYKCLVVIYKFWLVSIYQPNESIYRNLSAF